MSNKLKSEKRFGDQGYTDTIGNVSVFKIFFLDTFLEIVTLYFLSVNNFWHALLYGNLNDLMLILNNVLNHKRQLIKIKDKSAISDWL